MGIYHKRDIEGCNHAMSIVLSGPNYVKAWEHTKGEKDRYDIRITGATDFVFMVEVKNRECKMDDYDTVMFNRPKYDWIMNKAKETGEIPVFISSYYDGAYIYYLDSIPKEYIDQWTVEKWIAESTVENTPKRLQRRVMLPKPDSNNNYGQTIRLNEADRPDC